MPNRNPHIPRPVSTVLVTVLSFLTIMGPGRALASTLDDLLPRSSIVTLGVMPGEGGDRFLAPFADVDTSALQRAGDVIVPVLMELGEMGGPEILEMFADITSGGDPLEELAALCPDGVEVAMSLGDPAAWVDDAVVAVVADRFDPLPGVVAVARTTPESAAAVTALHEAIDGCIGGASLGTEGSTDLRIWLDGSDLPLVAARSDDLLVLGSRPDLVRGVLRRAAGADEPSLADRMRPHGPAPAASLVRGSIDVAALADVVATLPLPIDDADLGALLERAFASLRTLGYGEGFVVVDDGGVSVLQRWIPDADGGDAALYEILTCSSCDAEPSTLVPATAYVGSAIAIDRDGVTTWLDDLVQTVTGTLMGQPSTLGDVAMGMAGVDLSALFGWIGDEVHTAVLDRPSSSLRDLVYGPATVVAIDATSPDAARAGLDAWRAAIGGPLSSLLDAVADGDAAAMLGIGDVLVEDVVVDGTPVIRTRFGPTTDVAFTVVGDDLVVVSPFAAVTTVLHVASGALEGERSGDGFAAIASASTGPRIGFEYADARANLDALATVLDVVAQPLAFGVSTALAAALDEAGSFGSDDFGDFGGGFGPEILDDDMAWTTLDLSSLAVPPGPLDASVRGALTDETQTFDPFGDPYDFYVLPRFAPGTVVTVELTSNAFDTYLDLVDPVTGLVLLSNDDAGGFDRSEISFIADGRDLWVGVTRFGSGTGPYELTVTTDGDGTEKTDDKFGAQTDGAANDVTTAPTLAELLPAAEVPAAWVRALADRTGWYTRVTYVDDGVLFDEARWNVTW